MALPRYPRPTLARRADGSLWEASWEVDKWGLDLWARGLINPDRRFCFRRLVPNPARKPWWQVWRWVLPRWARTGEVWIGGDMCEGGFSWCRAGAIHNAMPGVG